MKCQRSDCAREAVFAVTDLAVDFMWVKGGEETAGAYVLDGERTAVCAEHLPEVIALAHDGCTGVEHWMVTAPDYGKTHLIAEAFPDDVSYG